MTAAVIMIAAVCVWLLARSFYAQSYGDFRMWRQRRRMAFAGAPVHRVVVPPGPDGRPGEEVLSPSLPAYVSRMFEGHEARGDFGVMLGKRSILQAVCLQRVGPQYQPDVSAARAIGSLHGKAGTLVEGPVECTLLGEVAQRYVMRLNSGRVLTEWHLVRSGWSFAIGVVQHPFDDESNTMRLAHQVFDSWRWTPAK